MTTLVDVLAAHQIEDDGFACTGCSWHPRNATVTDCEEFAAHQAEAVAAADLVVVKLPAATIIPSGWGDDCRGAWPVDADVPYIDPVSAWPQGQVADRDGKFMSADKARRTALALLAAARAAEQVTS